MLPLNYIHLAACLDQDLAFFQYSYFNSRVRKMLFLNQEKNLLGIWQYKSFMIFDHFIHILNNGTIQKKRVTSTILTLGFMVKCAPKILCDRESELIISLKRTKLYIHVKSDQSISTREHSLHCTHPKYSSNHFDKRTSCTVHPFHYSMQSNLSDSLYSVDFINI